MRRSSLDIANDLIVSHFDKMGYGVLSTQDMGGIFVRNSSDWKIAKSITVGKFIKYMLLKTPLKMFRLKFPNRPYIRYLWRDVSIYKIAASLRPHAYFSHYTAMGFHDVTNQISKTVYINDEQGPKPQSSMELEQSRIDLAFSRKPRLTRNIAIYEDFRICLLNGKNTGRLGVITMSGEHGEDIPVTCLERTLIDIVVRPFYAGGVFEVLDAYRKARDHINVPFLVQLLQELDYVYPYHQAIGGYMERTGLYTPEELALLKKFGMKNNFYLTFQMKNKILMKDWKLYVPKGF